MKGYRQGLIHELVDQEAVTSQERLRRRLRERGVDVTQATLSRDIKELGLVKRATDGAYLRPGAAGDAPIDPDAGLRRAVAEYVRRVDRVRELVILGTHPGQAQILGIAVDRAGLNEVAGTIAGDDTVMVVVRDARRAKMFVKQVERWAKG